MSNRGRWTALSLIAMISPGIRDRSICETDQPAPTTLIISPATKHHPIKFRLRQRHANLVERAPQLPAPKRLVMPHIEDQHGAGINTLANEGEIFGRLTVKAPGLQADDQI